MATNASKIDTATQEAYADAKNKKPEVSSSSNDDINLDAIAEAVEADTAASKTSPEKPAPKKIAEKRGLARKPARMDAKANATKAPAKLAPQSPKKENIMDKAQTKTTEYTARAKEGMVDMQSRTKAAYGKTSEIAGELGEFSKGNMEAVVASGKILASGMQNMGKTYVADAKSATEVMTADVKEVAAVRSPTELVQLQSKIVSRNFDATVAAVSKNTEAWIKLTNEAFAPISARMSLAMEKVRKAA